MREIALDFQPARPGLLAVVLVLAALVLAGDAWLEAEAAGDRAEEAQARVAQARRRLDRQEASRRENQPERVFSPEESKALGQAVGALRVDWEGLFAHIDRAASEEVALLAIRPSVGGRSVQIAGEAKHLEATLAFVEALKDKPLSQVVLVSHQIRSNDPQHPVAFEIAATWHPHE